jgi:ADP-heptose:LPS heptosyltransferase
MSLLSDVKKESFDAAIVFHAPWWVGLLLWLARVPLRAGVKSQWHSFLFFNRAIRQKRSRAEFSELEYGFQLVEAALARPAGSLRRAPLRLKGDDAGQLLRKFGLNAGEFIVVHPGMGGSALNWPTGEYAQLIRELLRKGIVAITGTAADEAYLSPLKSELSASNGVVWLDGRLSGPELLSVLAAAKAVLAPSTGVLHLSASLGRPTLGVFSPVRVQHPRRWGPQGPRTDVVVPAVACPGEMSCFGEACRDFDCMKSIKVEDVVRRLEALSKS